MTPPAPEPAPGLQGPLPSKTEWDGRGGEHWVLPPHRIWHPAQTEIKGREEGGSGGIPCTRLAWAHCAPSPGDFFTPLPPAGSHLTGADPHPRAPGIFPSLATAQGLQHPAASSNSTSEGPRAIGIGSSWGHYSSEPCVGSVRARGRYRGGGAVQRTQGMHHKKRAEVSYKYVCKSRAVHLLVLHEGAASRLDTSPGERGRLGHTHTLSLPPPQHRGEGKQGTEHPDDCERLPGAGNESQTACQQC